VSGNEDLLKALVQLVGRQAFPEDGLRELIGSERNQEAFNLCDGTRAQGAVAKTAGIDAGNFSRTVGRWLEAGIVFKIGEGPEARLLHVYPLGKERK
jgi:hypothetical protein